MVRLHVPLVVGLLLIPPAQGQQEQQFQEEVAAYLARAPMKIRYHYTLTEGEFQLDTTGVMVLVSPSVFRLELWDKVYASDGSSLYLHDRNTHQTVIDSLRWTEISLWVRLLHGELPPGTAAARIEPSQKGRVLWELSHEDPRWHGAVMLDSTVWSIREIQLREELGWEHLVRLEVPEPWDSTSQHGHITLQDLPGTRLDLR